MSWKLTFLFIIEIEIHGVIPTSSCGTSLHTLTALDDMSNTLLPVQRVHVIHNIRIEMLRRYYDCLSTYYNSCHA